MSQPKSLRYFYRAFFKPDSLDVFKGFDSGLNSNGRGLGYAQVWHRCNMEFTPYAIFSEFICGEIGRFLRLPIPPLAITYHVEHRKRQALFSSLDFNFNRAKLPQIIPERCVATLAPLCAGVLAFDILIANEDRHEENLLVDAVLAPKEMHVFDHDQALFGGAQTDGVERLKKLKDRLGITGQTVTGGNRHVFLDHVTCYADLESWVRRIYDIPEWFIENVCSNAIRFGLKRKLAAAATEFLIHRSKSLQSLIESNRSSFAIGDWPKQSTLPGM